MRPTSWFGIALLVMALVGLAWSVGGEPEAKIKVELKATTPTMTSDCPKAVNFEGFIEVTEACQVDYRFVRSDGATSRAERLTFRSAGRQTIRYTWTLGRNFRGWVAVEAAVVPARVLRPTFPPSTPVRSANAEFSLTCKPKITDVRLVYSPTGDFVALEVLGTNLGSYSSTKFLHIDGIRADVTEVVGWSDTKIDVDEEVFHEITSSLIWWDHTYQWSIVDGGTVISNVFPKRFKLHLHQVTPTSGSMDTAFEILGDGLSHPGNLMIGTQPVVSVSLREMHRIRGIIPSTIGPGTYQFSIVQGGTTISDTIPFTVR